MDMKSEQATPTQTPTSRIPALDGVRGVAILLVLMTLLRLYYSNIEVRAFGNEAQLDEVDLERSDDDIISYYRIPGRSP